MKQMLFTFFGIGIIWYFWYIRSLAEIARNYLQQYCQKQGLQYISVARKTSSLQLSKRYGISWFSEWEFEFSGDGETSYKGYLQMIGRHISRIDTPVFKTKDS